MGSFTLNLIHVIFVTQKARSGVYVLRIPFQIAAGDYDVLVRFLEYNRDRDFDCDGLFVSGGECDVYFKVCLQPLSPEQM